MEIIKHTTSRQESLEIIKHEVLQREAQANINEGFHIDQALNGIAVATWRNQPNHNTYNNLVKSKLDNYLAEFPNATPQQCYNFVSNLVNDIRDWVVSHPNSHLNDLVLP